MRMHGRAVGQAVVQTPDERHRVLVQPGHDREVPQRPRPVKPLAHEPPDDLIEPGASFDPEVVHRGDVVGDVERRIVEPHGIGDAQRCRHDPLTQATGGVKPATDAGAQLVEGWKRPRVRTLEHEHLARVAADHAAFELEDPRVLAGQAVNNHPMRPDRTPTPP